ncbi:M56 family metallopeptidase [Winogradskyella sp. UBA3174]|uniref:M56 family metallopeptidase n=1 Tax=Winogradskyella sp. UBA3174 TaxID=1947785 RepID=UPI0025E53E42|nr:M56 family metallopeptidase [Winogradskyella sp. UBA3174]|tara:strand:- start:4195 stop:6891 length:2697 start_codon:yes stop_codon:yes gene_type:complete
MEYLLKASLIIALFYLCFHFFLKKETFFNHNRWFLLLGIIIALIFPLVVIPIEVTVEAVTIPETFYVFNDTIPTQNFQPIVESSFNWTNLLSLIYGIGLVIFMIQFLFQFGSLILLLLKNPKNKDGIYTYVIVNNKISPFSFFKWIVYNPEAFNANELQLMLTHEKVHANQMHSLDILFTQLSCAIFWFNPLMWLYRKEVRQNLEYIADFKTQETSNNEKAYQRLLLKTSVTNQHISLSNNFYNSLIKERIVMLKKSRSHKKSQWRYFLMLPILAGLLMSMNTETIYVEENTATINNKDVLEFVVTKNTTNAELKSMSEAVEEKGGSLVFSQIERNNTDELTSIFLKLNNHSNGYGSGNSNQPMMPFLIYKEFFGPGGGYAGANGMGTLHFDDNENGDNPKAIKAFKTRTNNVLSKNNLQMLNLNNRKVTINHIEIVFHKQMSDQQLENIRKELKANDVTMTINKLKRNSKGEIKAINIDFKTQHGSSNYSVKNNNGIASFYFNINEDGSFGVGAIKKNDVVIIESVQRDDYKNRKSNFGEVIEVIEDTTKYVLGSTIRTSKPDSLYYKVTGRYRGNFENDTIRVAKGFYIDSTDVKRLFKIKTDNFFENNYKNPKPLIVLNGKIISNYNLSTIDPKGIKSISILKKENAMELYGKKGENGAVIITMKNNATISGTKAIFFDEGEIPTKIINQEITTEEAGITKQTLSKLNKKLNKPMYIIEGKVLNYNEFNMINPNDIKGISILKGESATSIYGEKGKDGVIVMVLKDGKKSSWESKLASKEKGPWEISRAEISSVQFIDDEDPTKNGTLAYISRYSSDKVLESQKTLLEQQGITVKYSKVRRDKNGEITSIKISLNNNKGQETSAKFKNDNGITSIRFGLSEGSLVVSTTNMDKFD